jgi:adenylate kinase
MAALMKNSFRILLLLPAVLFSQAPTDGKLVVVMLGPPGSGKTTQAGKLSAKYRIPSISMADVLKKSAGWGKAGSKKQLKAEVESGRLVNDEIANGMIKDRLYEGDTDRGFILDGYPATAKQAEFLDSLLKERGLPQPIVVDLQVPDDVVKERMRRRRRADDKAGYGERRLSDYHREASAISGRYGSRLIAVDASGSEADVWRSVEKAVESRAPAR